MPARTLPNLGLKAGYDLGEDGWGDDMTLNLLAVSVLTQGTALSKLSALPGSPANGDIYILDETHGTQPNRIAVRDNGVWVYLTPVEGWLIYNRAENYYERFDGSVWSELATGGGGGGSGSYNVAFAFGAGPGGAASVMLHTFTESVEFADNFGGSFGFCESVPTATTTLTVRRNTGGVTTTIGTIQITTSGAVTFNTTGTGVESFAAGDTLLVKNQATADATIADCSFTLKGTRV